MPTSADEWSDLDFQVIFRISDSPVHLGVQQGRGVLVYRGGPLIESKKGVRAPGNDIRQTCTDAVHSSTFLRHGGHLCPGAAIGRPRSSTEGSWHPFILPDVFYLQMCAKVVSLHSPLFLQPLESRINRGLREGPNKTETQIVRLFRNQTACRWEND